MASEWRLATLGDVAVFENRHRIPLSAAQRSVRKGEYPYWGANGPFDFVDDYLFEGPRVLVAEDGNTVVKRDGRGTVHWATGRYWVNNHAHVLSVADGHDLRWLYYVLLGSSVRDLVSGSAQPKLSMGSVKQLRLLVAPPAEQRAIASVLGALDDTIESNERLATLADETSALLNHRVAVIGEAPGVSWTTKPFSDAVDVNPRVRITKGAETPFVAMADVDPFGTRPTRSARRSFSGGAKFDRGDTLMARITGCIEHGKGAFVDFVDEPSAGSTEFVVFRARPPLSPEGVFALSRDARLRAHAIANMTGTSGRQRVDNACWDSLDVALAPASAQRDAAIDAMEQMMALSRGAWLENQTLTATRDALLPKLVSGRIRVPLSDDHEESLGAALAAHSEQAA